MRTCTFPQSGAAGLHEVVFDGVVGAAWFEEVLEQAGAGGEDAGTLRSGFPIGVGTDITGVPRGHCQRSD
jgi:hypothetical protein